MLLVAATNEQDMTNPAAAAPIPPTGSSLYPPAAPRFGYIARARDRREVTLLLALHSEVDVRRAFQLDVHHVRSPSLTTAAISLP